jgi:hypothetical protein
MNIAEDTTANRRADVRPGQRISRLKRTLAGVTLVSLGAAGGGYLVTASGAGASTQPTSAATTAATGSTGVSAPRGMALRMSGTVTAVGTASVTIGTTVYAVDTNSDIDKNGESTLSALAIGDAVTFSTVTTNGTVTIDKLHTGTESLNHPPGAPFGAPGGAPGA